MNSIKKMLLIMCSLLSMSMFGVTSTFQKDIKHVSLPEKNFSIFFGAKFFRDKQSRGSKTVRLLAYKDGKNIVIFYIEKENQDYKKDTRVFTFDKDVLSFAFSSTFNFVEVHFVGTDETSLYNLHSGKAHSQVKKIYNYFPLRELNLTLNNAKTMFISQLSRDTVLVLNRISNNIQFLWFPNKVIDRGSFLQKSLYFHSDNELAVRFKRCNQPNIVPLRFDTQKTCEQQTIKLSTGDKIADHIIANEQDVCEMKNFIYKTSTCQKYVVAYFYKKKLLKIYDKKNHMEPLKALEGTVEFFEFLDSEYGTYLFFKGEKQDRERKTPPKRFGGCLPLGHKGDLVQLSFKKGERYLISKLPNNTLVIFDLLTKKQIGVDNSEENRIKEVRNYCFFSYKENDYLLIYYNDNKLMLKNLSKNRSAHIIDSKVFNGHYYYLSVKDVIRQQFLVNFKDKTLMSALSDVTNDYNKVKNIFVEKNGDHCFVLFVNDDMSCFDIKQNKKAEGFVCIPGTPYAVLLQKRNPGSVLYVYNINTFERLDTLPDDGEGLIVDYFIGDKEDLHVVVEKQTAEVQKRIALSIDDDKSESFEITLIKESLCKRYRVYSIARKKIILVDTVKNRQININYSNVPLLSFEFFDDENQREYFLIKNTDNTYILIDLQARTPVRCAIEEYKRVLLFTFKDSIMIFGRGTNNAVTFNGLAKNFSFLEAKQTYYLCSFDEQTGLMHVYRLASIDIFKNMLSFQKFFQLRKEYLFHIKSGCKPKLFVRQKYLIATCKDEEKKTYTKVYDLKEKTQMMAIRSDEQLDFYIQKINNQDILSGKGTYLRVFSKEKPDLFEDDVENGGPEIVNPVHIYNQNSYASTIGSWANGLNEYVAQGELLDASYLDEDRKPELHQYLVRYSPTVDCAECEIKYYTQEIDVTRFCSKCRKKKWTNLQAGRDILLVKSREKRNIHIDTVREKQKDVYIKLKGNSIEREVNIGSPVRRSSDDSGDDPTVLGKRGRPDTIEEGHRKFRSKRKKRKRKI